MIEANEIDRAWNHASWAAAMKAILLALVPLLISSGGTAAANPDLANALITDTATHTTSRAESTQRSSNT